MMHDSQTATSLEQLRFDNRFVRELPADASKSNQRRQVHHACYSRVDPTPVGDPELVAFSQEMVELLQIPFDPNDAASCETFTQVFVGNQQLPGMEPYATCYGGHQFGNWAGQLGDGRAINLGELPDQDGRLWTLQLKGAGPTPYSRTADGLAVLRSSLREFLCSEAMHHLGIPTTRALSLITTGEQVQRDMFYDGNPKLEPGAVVCRVAPSFTRFGSFEIFAARKDIDHLKLLVDYTIKYDFPHLGPPSPETYAAWFHEVCVSTASLIVQWLRVGFVHGVMNTDNMSILGLTIDYGPYGWLDDFDPHWTPNTTDATGRRYRFGQQPQVAMWNLQQLAYALSHLMEDNKPLETGLAAYSRQLGTQWQDMMANKLGLDRYHASDETLIDELVQVLRATETDMTIFYRQLAKLNLEQLRQPSDDKHADHVLDTLRPALYHPAAYEQNQHSIANLTLDWVQQYATRSQAISEQQRITTMRRTNPKYVLRNYLAQLAIDELGKGSRQKLQELMHVLRTPYDEHPQYEQLAAKRPDWARNRPGCSMLSCSS